MPSSQSTAFFGLEELVRTCVWWRVELALLTKFLLHCGNDLIMITKIDTILDFT